jgi:hypothetical protein
MGAKERLVLRDRAWLSHTWAFALGPADLPSVDAVRKVLMELVELDPDSVLLRRLDSDRGCWLRVPPDQREQYARDVIVDLDDDAARIGDPREDPSLFEAVLADRYRDGLGDLSFRISLGRQYAVYEQSHALGDAHREAQLWPYLLACATEGLKPERMAGRDVSLPLPRAIFHTFVKHPTQLGALLGSGRRGAPAQPAPDDAGTPPVESAPVPVVETHAEARFGEEGSEGRLRNVTARSSPGLTDRLREWRIENGVEASVSSVLLAATHAAMVCSDLPRKRDGFVVLFDARRYLPKKASRVHSNFSMGVLLAPADPTSPEQYDAEIRRTTTRGVPLGMMLRSVIRMWLGRVGQSSRPAAPVAPPAVTFTYIKPDMKGLRWTAPPEERWYGVIHGVGHANEVTFGCTEIEGVLNISVSFDANRFDPETVRAIARTLATDPTSVLDARAVLR